jgi:hypothetical protein
VDGSSSNSSGSSSSSGKGEEAEDDKNPIDNYNLRPVKHLVLCIHGIGEDLWSQREDWKFPEAINRVRSRSLSMTADLFPESDRVEFLPILWHSVLHDTDVKQQLLTTTLKNLDSMRKYANGVVMDVLFFVQPIFHQIIVDCVSKKMNDIVAQFCTNNPSFTPSNVSMLGHSLGSTIVFDILTHQNQPTDTSSEVVGINYPKLTFKPQNLFCIGSPTGMFEAIRPHNQCKLHEYDFQFFNNCNIWNIFHPYDPVAYRIEPLIHAEFEHIPPVAALDEDAPEDGDGKRSQRQPRKPRANSADSGDFSRRISAFFGGGTSAGTPPAPIGDHAQTDDEKNEVRVQQLINTLGAFNGHRIDFQLQETALQRAQPTLASISTHSSYWGSKDVLTFVMRKLQGRVLTLDCARQVHAHHSIAISAADSNNNNNSMPGITEEGQEKTATTTTTTTAANV